ncbi:hypothetical protein [Pseudactinotalea terrae]|uniref:hypothetical protein n=1 Tax=Pseudactinotalea terrae TaxID=1743262 RepID=UPI001F4F186B|nr:hypothetical protein [Pseudactinotalea terrae]
MSSTQMPMAADGRGLLLSESVIASPWFGVLAAFVALNTIMYVALAVAQIFPKVYPSDWFGSRSRRQETRSIYPDGPVG